MANRWLFKTEPSAYSWADLVEEKRTVWDGVKNPQALKNLSRVKKGDRVLIYHTGAEKAAVGIARAITDAYPDPELDDPRRFVVDLVPVKPLVNPVSLKTVKAEPSLASFDLVRLPRLSVMAVSADQWSWIESQARRG